MEEVLQRSQGSDLKVSVLLDYTRGSRGSFPGALVVVTVELRSLRPHPLIFF